MTRKITAALVLLTGLSLGVIACSSGSSTSSKNDSSATTAAATDSSTAANSKAAADLDPCTLLSAGQVSAAIARPVGPPTTIKVTPIPPNGSACNWTATAKQGELIERTARVDIWNWSSVPADWKSNNASPKVYVERICNSKDVVSTKVDIPGFVSCQTEFLTYVANDKYLAVVGVPNLAASDEAKVASVQLAKDVAAKL